LAYYFVPDTYYSFIQNSLIQNHYLCPMNLLSLSWKNIRHNPLATLLSVTLFALGIGLMVFLFLVQKQLDDNFKKNLAGIDLVVGAKGSPLQLILSSMYHIDAPTGNVKLGEVRPYLNPKHPTIETAIPLSMGDSYREYRILGTTQEFIHLYDAALAEGKIWQYNMEVTLGANVAAALGLQLGDTFSSSHGFADDDHAAHDDSEFKVVGILAPTGSVIDQLILTTTQSFWLVHEHAATPEDTHDHDHAHHDHSHDHAPTMPPNLLNEPEEKEITSLLIKFKGRGFQALNLGRNINEKTEMQAASPAIEINRLYSLMGTGEQVLQMLAFVIIFVSGLSIFISLFSSLRERQYELSLMRVMGAGRKKLFTLIILEGLLLAIIGYVIGVLLGHVAMQIMASTMEDAYKYSFSAWQFLPIELWLLAGALLIGFVAAALPALQAARMDVAETLAKG